MPIKTWNLNQINVGGTNPNRLWWDEAAAVAAATSVTGWTVAKTALGNYRLLSQGAEVAGFSTTIQPTATAPVVDNSYNATAIYTPPDLLSDIESISTLYEYNGYFPAGDWTFNFPVIAVGAGGQQDGRMGIRVFKASRSGTAFSGTTQLTAARLVGTTVSNLATTVAQTSTVTWTAPIVRLNYEFLIIKMAWEITGATNNNASDVVLRYGTGASMVSPNFRKRSYNITSD